MKNIEERLRALNVATYESEKRPNDLLLRFKQFQAVDNYQRELKDNPWTYSLPLPYSREDSFNHE